MAPPSIGLGRMLRTLVVQHWFNLFDEVRKMRCTTRDFVQLRGH
jgi:hypothetical protein